MAAETVYITLLAIVALIAVGLGILAWTAQNDADRYRARAVRANERAQAWRARAEQTRRELLDTQAQLGADAPIPYQVTDPAPVRQPTAEDLLDAALTEQARHYYERLERRP